MYTNKREINNYVFNSIISLEEENNLDGGSKVINLEIVIEEDLSDTGDGSWSLWRNESYLFPMPGDRILVRLDQE